MIRKQGSTLFLKGAVVLMGAAVLAFCIFALPLITKEAVDYFPPHQVYPVIVIIYASAIPFFVALYQALKLLSYIDRNEAFSELSVRALRNIKFDAIVISVLYAASVPFLISLADYDDAPGIIVIGVVVIFASMVIAVFAAVLQSLLKSALDIKSENDLTI